MNTNTETKPRATNAHRLLEHVKSCVADGIPCHDGWRFLSDAIDALAAEPTERQFMALACEHVDGADSMLPVARGAVIALGRARWNAFLVEGAASKQGVPQ